MVLTEKETAALKDLQSQEKTCAQKYQKYSEQAKDPELKNLFQTIQKEEQKHYDSLGQVLNGTVPECDCNDSKGKDYSPKATYMSDDNSQDKTDDCFWRLTALVQKSWFLRNIIRMFSCLGSRECVSCWQISRSRSRIMRRCCINIRQ